jgi:hypothetical protein
LPSAREYARPRDQRSPRRQPKAPPQGQEHRSASGVAFDTSRRKASTTLGIEGIMVTRRQHGQIIETPTEARQAEPGPSVLALLAVSTGLAVLILGLIWVVFFHT